MIIHASLELKTNRSYLGPAFSSDDAENTSKIGVPYERLDDDTLLDKTAFSQTQRLWAGINMEFGPRA